MQSVVGWHSVLTLGVLGFPTAFTPQGEMRQEGQHGRIAGGFWTYGLCSQAEKERTSEGKREKDGSETEAQEAPCLGKAGCWWCPQMLK